jgi:Helicase conserved C-terminal domain
MNYEEFIRSKTKRLPSLGIEIDEGDLNPRLMDWQKRVVSWAMRRGRAALFEDCGLGKTFQQLEWARLVHRQTQMPVVVHCPVGVRHQTKRESEKFDIECQVEVVDSSDAVINGINLVNYEKLHRFDGVEFGGVVLDESSILKSVAGKTKAELIARYEGTRFKLACTATPSPNDTMELGNHAEFLGVCEASDMLNRFFFHDSGDTSKWVLMPHGHGDFWKWVAQWAVCIGKPSDIGGLDDGFALPELRTHRHTVEADIASSDDGYLFSIAGLSATNIHEEKRKTCDARCAKAAEIAASVDGQCLIWCDTNYEADALAKLLPDAVEVRGSDKDSIKESRLLGFGKNEFRVLISKPSIAGMGMNWQNCSTMIFAGLSYSFEDYYQAVRRCWRYGQTRPVDVHIVIADSESAITSAIARKESDFDAMRCGMADAMRESTLEEFGLREGKRSHVASDKFSVPSFLEV